MSKYWGLIFTSRPRIFAFGSHDDFDKATVFAQEFVDRKNTEIEKFVIEKNIPENQRQPDYYLMCLLNEDELRSLIGDVHRPLVIAKPKREEVGVEAPIRRGGTTTDVPATVFPNVETAEPEEGGEAAV
jgi:hypothetical protein